jgi:hypothetical protein
MATLPTFPFPQFLEEPTGPAFNTPPPTIPDDLLIKPEIMADRIQIRPRIDLSSVMVNGVFTPKLQTLEDSEYRELSNNAFFRILTVEKQAESGGKALLRRSLLCRLATSIDLQDNLLFTLLDHILENFNSRKELALSWITQELLEEVQTKEEEEYSHSEESRYNKILNRLIESLDNRIDSKDRSLSYLILETPILTDEVFNLLSNYCAQPDKFTMGFSILRDITLYRPTYTNKALDMLLNFTSHPDDLVRSTAVKLVTNRLYIGDREDSISLLIEDYATKLLTTLYVLPADEQPDTESAFPEPFTEEEIKRRLLLFLSLCTKKQDLLQGYKYITI